MRQILIIKIFVATLITSCKKEQISTCKCEFPFMTGNPNTPFLAIHGESYWYNNDCWTYLGPSKDRLSSRPSIPRTNFNEWRKCSELNKDCNAISATTQTWTAGIHYRGDKVKLNNKIYIAFTQGNPKPEATDDDIWAKLCD